MITFPKEKPKAEIPFIIFCSFLCTFITARLVVFGLQGGWLQVGGYLYVQHIHIHHLNYGIFLLSIVGFGSLTTAGKTYQRGFTILYGIALGLTFDEFGMWLRLQDVYYSPLSYDAVTIIALILALITSYGTYADRLIKRRASYIRDVPKGSILFNERDMSDEAYLIIQGTVEIFRIHEGKRHILAHLGPAELVGEMALFTGQGRSASAQALTPLKVRPLTKNTLLYNLEEHPELSVTLIRVLAERLIIANNQSSTSKSD
jgi:hypothetical protein